MMKYISHRGNINGKDVTNENKLDYIDTALSMGYDVEIDIWFEDFKLLLGHDGGLYVVDLFWLTERYDKLWLHCKNLEAVFYFKELDFDFNYFWHQNDDITITSQGYFWTYPGKKISNNSIAVLPEVDNFENIEHCFGICSDYIERYKLI